MIWEVNWLGYLSWIVIFQDNASKLLLAIMESRHDSENAERILYNMTSKQLVTLDSSYYNFSQNSKYYKKNLFLKSNLLYYMKFWPL